MRLPGIAVVFGLVAASLQATTMPARGQWALQSSGTKARLRGLSVVSDKVAWASGTGGTVVRTTDQGVNWQAGIVPGAEKLDFRDIHAVDDRTAYVLSAGLGDLSKIYKTTDGGKTWGLRFINPDAAGFLDAIAFWDADHGLAFGDPVEGRFAVFTTDDGGKSWSRIAREGMPPALPGEGAFAASGTCLVALERSHAWFGTGGAKASRVFRSADRGQTWKVEDTPVKAGTASAGIFSLAFRDADHGLAIGGDYKRPGDSGGYVALTADGGKTWRPAKANPPAGFKSAIGFATSRNRPAIVAVGTSGTDISRDDGETWTHLGAVGYHAVGFTNQGDAGWAVGDEGSIAAFDDAGIPK